MDRGVNEKWVEQLSAYLDGELTAAQRAEVESRLATDPAVQLLLDDLRGISDSLKSLPRAKASDELMDALRARMERRALLDEETSIRQTVVATGRQPRRWLAVAALLGLSLTAGIAMWAFSDYRKSNSPSSPRYVLLDETSDVHHGAPGVSQLSQPHDSRWGTESNTELERGGEGGIEQRESAPATPSESAERRLLKIGQPAESLPTADRLATADEKEADVDQTGSVATESFQADGTSPPCLVAAPAAPALKQMAMKKQPALNGSDWESEIAVAEIAKSEGEGAAPAREVANDFSSRFERTKSKADAVTTQPLDFAAPVRMDSQIAGGMDSLDADKYLWEQALVNPPEFTLDRAMTSAPIGVSADNAQVDTEPAHVRVVAFWDSQQMDQAVMDLQNRYADMNVIRNESVMSASADLTKQNASAIANAPAATQPGHSSETVPTEVAEWTIDVPDERSQRIIVSDLERSASNIALAQTMPATAPADSSATPSALKANQAVDLAIPPTTQWQNNAFGRRLLVEVRVTPLTSQSAPSDPVSQPAEPRSLHGGS